MRNSSESEVTLVTLEHAECQKVLESSKTQNYISKIMGEQKIFDNFDKFLTCDLPSSLLQKRVSVGGDGAIRIASGLQNPKYFKNISKIFPNISNILSYRYIEDIFLNHPKG